MKKILILAAILSGLIFYGMAQAIEGQTFVAEVTQTNADTASVGLKFPNSTQTILIKDITFWYDNAANTNTFYVGIVSATAAHTRQLWLSQTMANAGVNTVQLNDINYKITPSVAQAGVRVFLSASTSDSISALVEYEFVPQ